MPEWRRMTSEHNKQRIAVPDCSFVRIALAFPAGRCIYAGLIRVGLTPSSSAVFRARSKASSDDDTDKVFGSLGWPRCHPPKTDGALDSSGDGGGFPMGFSSPRWAKSRVKERSKKYKPRH